MTAQAEASCDGSNASLPLQAVKRSRLRRVGELQPQREEEGNSSFPSASACPLSVPAKPQRHVQMVAQTSDPKTHVLPSPATPPDPKQRPRPAAVRSAAPASAMQACPPSARAQRAAKRQQNSSPDSSPASDPVVCAKDSAELETFFGTLSGSEESGGPSSAAAASARTRQRVVLQRGQASESSDGDGSDASIASGKRRKRSATQALQVVSAAAQAKVLETLSGPVVDGEPETAVRRRHNAVRRAIVRGHTKLRTDYWASSDEFASRCEKFGDLMAHQRVGIRWMLGLHTCVPGMILADEMGLGKTAQALCFLELLASPLPTLIVAPASLLTTWETEAAKWTPKLRTLKFHSPSSNIHGRVEAQAAFRRNPHAYQVVITTPQAFNNKENRSTFFRKVQFEYLIVDEAHGLKNADTSRYKEISKTIRCNHRMLLTGTPVQNCLAELATLLGFALADGKSKSASEELRAISEDSLTNALKRMQSLAAPLILRRLKTDVLSQLPEKRGLVVYCDLTAPQRTMYDEEMKLARTERQIRLKSTCVKDVFFALRRVCLHPLLCKRRLTMSQNKQMAAELREKRPDFAKASLQRCEQEVIGWSDFEKHQQALENGLSSEFLVTEGELLDNGKVIELLRILKKQAETSDKTLVFSQFTQVLDIIEVVMKVSSIPFVRLDGKTAIEDRAAIVAGFQGDSGAKVFLISTKAGGMGLNLTAANAVVMLDLDFNPQNSRQAEDRVHRLGQTREVTIHYLVCRGTVEELVLRRNLEKMQLDQHFGAKRGCLELAANAVEVEEMDEDVDDEDAVIEDAGILAKQCEKDVMKEFRTQLAAAV